MLLTIMLNQQLTIDWPPRQVLQHNLICLFPTKVGLRSIVKQQQILPLTIMLSHSQCVYLTWPILANSPERNFTGRMHCRGGPVMLNDKVKSSVTYGPDFVIYTNHSRVAST